MILFNLFVELLFIFLIISNGAQVLIFEFYIPKQNYVFLKTLNTINYHIKADWWLKPRRVIGEISR